MNFHSDLGIEVWCLCCWGYFKFRPFLFSTWVPPDNERKRQSTSSSQDLGPNTFSWGEKKYYVQSRRGDKSEHLPRIHHLTHFCFFTYDIGRVHISNIQYEMLLEVEDRQDWCQIGIPKKIFLAREETLTSNSPVFLSESNCSFVSLFKRPLESTAMLLLSSKLGSTKRSLRLRVFFRMDEVLPVNFEVFMMRYSCIYFYALKKVSFSQKSSFPNLLKKDLWNGITRTSKNPQRKRILIGVIYQGWRKFEII